MDILKRAHRGTSFEGECDTAKPPDLAAELAGRAGRLAPQGKKQPQVALWQALLFLPAIFLPDGDVFIPKKREPGILAGKFYPRFHIA